MLKTFTKFNQLKKELKNIEIIGKGWRGTVYKAHFEDLLLSVKVPNSKEHINAIQKEGKILEIVNQYNIGGKLVFQGEDFIAYEYIDGIHLKDYINEKNYKDVVLQLFEQARLLDKLGINKDEMQRPLKNALISKDEKVILIDFERVNFSEKPSNITQLLQFVMRTIYFKNIDKQKLINLGKEYKKSLNEKTYEKILKTIFEV
jgi:putative serine/threonine protein kinase